MQKTTQGKSGAGEQDGLGQLVYGAALWAVWDVKGDDLGPDERWQHSGRTLERAANPGHIAARAIEEHVLDRLTLAHIITPAQREAAFRLKKDFHDAGLTPHMVGSYSPVRAQLSVMSFDHDRSDAQEEAYARWRAAIKFIGPLFSDSVITAACHDCFPMGRGQTHLYVGLKKLVDWYAAADSAAKMGVIAGGA